MRIDSFYDAKLMFLYIFVPDVLECYKAFTFHFNWFNQLLE